VPVGDRQLGLEALVLLAQPLILGAQRLHALAQRRPAGALPRGDTVGARGCPIAQHLDLPSQRRLRVEPLARDAGAASNALEADGGALGVQLAQRLLGSIDCPLVAGRGGLVERLSRHGLP
jgi:hypothetical protein